MLDRVFNHGLQQHAGDKGVERLFVDLLEDLQLVAAEADHFDIEVIVDEFEFFAQRHKCLVLAQQPPQDIRQASRRRRAPCRDRSGSAKRRCSAC